MSTRIVNHPCAGAAFAYLEGTGGVEFIDGRLVERFASVGSASVAATVGALLHDAADVSGAAVALSGSMGYRCFRSDPDRVRKPAATVVRTARLKWIDPDEPFLTLPPDLAVEVISPNDMAYDVSTRVEDYLANGFPLIWVIYPATRTVVIHRRDGSTALLHARDEITGEAALPGFRCKVADFFPAPLPAPAA